MTDDDLDLYMKKIIRGGMMQILEYAEQYPEAVATFVKAIGKEEEFGKLLKDIRSLLATQARSAEPETKTVIH